MLSGEELYMKADWDGVNGRSRDELLSYLSRKFSLSFSHFVLPVEFIPTTHLIPDGRLQTLLNQATAHQINNCLYHNIRTPISLFKDHTCPRSSFPHTSITTIQEHTDEVWFLAFSNSGDLLASASKDSTIIVWDIRNEKTKWKLIGHDEACSFLAWSSDDKLLLTASNDRSLKVWDIDVKKNKICPYLPFVY